MSGSLQTILSIDNIRVKAYHGWYESERKIGGMYTISVRIFSDISSTDSFDSMDQSVNYEGIYSEVLSVMKEEFKLIEDCCKNLFDRLKKLKSDVVWEITLVKEDVPIKHVGSTSFTIKG